MVERCTPTRCDTYAKYHGGSSCIVFSIQAGTGCGGWSDRGSTMKMVHGSRSQRLRGSMAKP